MPGPALGPGRRGARGLRILSRRTPRPGHATGPGPARRTGPHRRRHRHRSRSRTYGDLTGFGAPEWLILAPVGDPGTQRLPSDPWSL